MSRWLIGIAVLMYRGVAHLVVSYAVRFLLVVTKHISFIAFPKTLVRTEILCW